VPRFVLVTATAVTVLAAIAAVIILSAAGPASAAFSGRNGLIGVHTFDDQMWVVRPDGTGLTRLPAPGEGAYSADGRQLALADGRTLTVTDLNGANPRTLYRANPSRVCVCAPAWSPTGDRVYFDGLFAVPAAGGPVTRIARDGEDADVSATGRLAYLVDPKGTGNGRIFTSDSSGGDVRLLGRGSSPSWSPDGARIAFVRDDALYIANADGSAPTQVRKHGTERDFYVAWSPDGAELAFVRQPSLDGDLDRLSVLTLATGAVRNLLSASRLKTDFLSDVEWQALQGNDQIVLPKAPTLGQCQALGSVTVHRTKQVRVFTKNGDYYGCLYRTNRRFRLVRDSEIEFGLNMGKIRIAGPYVGFGYTLDEADFGSVGHVRVLDLRKGSRKHDTFAAHAFYSDVYDVAMTRSGAVAWIAKGYADIEGERLPAGCKRTSSISCDFAYEVNKLDRSRVRKLDSGRHIRPMSLALHGQRLSWRNGHTRRSALLR
jgi:hypothetical protein